uniref:Putative SPX domain-containing protein 1 n=1 Tax=Davidia involucrata TaxID=16924 RepID=A0A5B6YY74_DAVIN
MKFWKSLSNLIEETLPDWRDKFLSYKDLKKQLKLIYPKEGESGRANKRPRLCDDPDSRDDRTDSTGDCTVAGGGESEEVMTKEVIDFVRLLEEEIEKFNLFFVDNEEEYIIRLKVLQDRVAEARNSNEELMKVGREIVDFHGEMILLENYSALNYTGLVKILKKYDKRSGALIRLPFIQKVLQQPFYKTDVLNKLVKESETMLEQLFSMNERSAPAEAAERSDTKTAAENRERLLTVPEELAEIENMESSMHMKTVSALRVLKEIRSGSSTINMFSLPPLQSNELGEAWKKIPVLEQTAK